MFTHCFIARQGFDCTPLCWRIHSTKKNMSLSVKYSVLFKCRYHLNFDDKQQIVFLKKNINFPTIFPSNQFLFVILHFFHYFVLPWIHICTHNALFIRKHFSQFHTNERKFPFTFSPIFFLLFQSLIFGIKIKLIWGICIDEFRQSTKISFNASHKISWTVVFEHRF